MIINNTLAFVIKELVSQIAGENAGEFVSELAKDCTDIMLHNVFGHKNSETPNGQFLMLIDDSLCEFCKYLADREFEYDPKAYTRIKAKTVSNCMSDEKLLKSILKEMLGDESYNLLNEEDIKKWFRIIDYRLPQNKYEVLFRYVLKHRNNQKQLDAESVLKIVQALNTINGEKTIEDVLCDWFLEHYLDFSDATDNNVLEIGYILTDYLEKRKNYGKSVEIANQLLKVYDNDEDLYVHNKEYIRKIIGCAYSLAIANVTPEDKKRKLLREASLLFDKAKKMCKKYENTRGNQYEDIEFLWGLYYSDYGAMLVNKGNLYKNKGDFSKAKKCYKKAEKNHKLSLEKRKKLKKALKTSKLYDKKEIKNMIARTKSNIGGVYFRLERYEDSINMQKKALKTFIKQRDIIRQFRTEELIVGNYISLWESDINLMSHSDFEMCMNYMNSAKFYYEITNNKSLDGILKKILKLKELAKDKK